jgi:large subunit ribosomal protein L4
MAKVQVLNATGQAAGEVELPADVFSYPVKSHLLYESVVQHQATIRRGTAATKTRGEVTGSNRKPWRQKGTGRARAGSIRSPLWRKGGRMHGPQPRDYSYEIPRQARRSALKSALALRLAENRLVVLAEANLAEPKTKVAAKWLNSLNLDSALIVDKNENRNLFVALRNIPKTKAVDAAELSAFDVLSHTWLVFTRRALESLIERMSK